MRIEDLDADGYSWGDAYSSGPPPADDSYTDMPYAEWLRHRARLLDAGYVIVHVSLPGGGQPLVTLQQPHIPASEQRRQWLARYDELEHELR